MKKFFIEIMGNAKGDKITVKAYTEHGDDYLNAKKSFTDYNTAREWSADWVTFLHGQRDIYEIEVNDYVGNRYGEIYYSDEDDD